MIARMVRVQMNVEFKVQISIHRKNLRIIPLHLNNVISLLTRLVSTMSVIVLSLVFQLSNKNRKINYFPSQKFRYQLILKNYRHGHRPL